MNVTPDLLDNANLVAFLRLIRAGESSQDPSAYWVMFGGRMADSLADHPRQKNSAAGLTSTAAGAYQFLSKTWDECAKALDLPDFGPASQDLAAVFLIKRRGALEDVLAGRIETAIQKCAKEWASLPGSPYGQPTRTLEQALATYATYGGSLNTTAEPVETEPENVHTPAQTEWDLQNPPPPPKEPAMAFPLLPMIAQVLIGEAAAQIPRLTQLFKPSSPVAERNVALATMALDVVGKAVGATNAQEAVERIKSDPGALQAARAAVDANWAQLQEAHEASIGRARDFARSAPERIVFWNMVFHEVLALLMVCISAAGAAMVLLGNFSNELKIAVVTLMIVGGYTGIKEFFYGGSRGSDTKNAALIERWRQ